MMNKLRLAVAILLTALVLPVCWGLAIVAASTGGRSIGAYTLISLAATCVVVALNFHLSGRPSSKVRGFAVFGAALILWAAVVAGWVAFSNGPALPGWLVFLGLFPATLWIAWSAWMFVAPLRWSLRLGTLALFALLIAPFVYYFQIEGATVNGRIDFDLRPPHSLSRVVRSAFAKLTGREIVLLPKSESPPPAAVTGVRSRYTKYEYRIPMRDGKQLFTAVYVPKDDAKPYPILLYRTPYSIRPYGADQFREQLGPSPQLEKSGYIFAYQDVRGRWMSEGEFVHMRPCKDVKTGPADVDESTDTYDTIDWLLKHVPNNNGKVGLWGISYPGFYAAAGMIGAHPALLAVSPQAPITDWFMGDDWHHNGALILAHMFSFMSRNDRPRPAPTKTLDTTFDYKTPDGYAFFMKLGSLLDAGRHYLRGKSTFWDESLQHGTYDDFWKSRNLRPHIQHIQPAVLMVGGWFDAENLFGSLEVFRALEKNSPATTSELVMGPWSHGGWAETDGAALGDVHFDTKTSDFYRSEIEFPFFEHTLKGKPQPQCPKAWIFETGTNVWRKWASWPPPNARPKSLYFREQGKLNEASPAAADEKSADEWDEYVSDPSRPVPYTETIVARMTKDYMTGDQRFASRRPDVLVYASDVLEKDVTIAGPIQADLFVSTTGTDSDWIVKLIDVYPDDYPERPGSDTRMGGYQQLVRGDVMRGKFRESFEKPQPFVSGKPENLKFTLQDICHTFRSGHRIMVQVQSTWFPLVDRNPQTFMDIYRAQPKDFHPATQRVYHSRNRASRLSVLVLP